MSILAELKRRNVIRMAGLYLVETCGTKLHENVKNEGINSAYRVAFGMRIPSDLQAALASNCGDRSSRVNDDESIKNARARAIDPDSPLSDGLVALADPLQGDARAARAGFIASKDDYGVLMADYTLGKRKEQSSPWRA